MEPKIVDTLLLVIHVRPGDPSVLLPLSPTGASDILDVARELHRCRAVVEIVLVTTDLRTLAQEISRWTTPPQETSAVRRQTRWLLDQSSAPTQTRDERERASLCSRVGCAHRLAVHDHAHDRKPCTYCSCEGFSSGLVRVSG